MIGIYKITNKINGHSYVGQSVNIKKRWSNHKTACFNKNEHTYDYPLYRAIRKYGINNFDFQVLEECSIEELDKKEIFWISYYNTHLYGYNQDSGGNGHFNKLNNSLLLSITGDLKNSELSLNDISKKYNTSYEMITGINTGRYWRRDIDYPIRVFEPKVYYCDDCGKIVSRGKYLCVDCHLHRIRENRPSKDVLSDLLLKYTMVAIGDIYNVTSNCIKKWCKSYGLPYKYNDIKEYRINTFKG